VPALIVRHNIEVAHRLHRLRGKCEAIHGHSMWVDLELDGALDDRGLLDGLDFGEVKRAYRAHLDDQYDHRLLLDVDDPIAAGGLPGLRVTNGQPTTENIACWVGRWAASTFNKSGRVTVHETHANAARWEWTA
jgi:6-pyruvoyltetrahydropterin/6-carboxytetrahydropterin synthase